MASGIPLAANRSESTTIEFFVFCTSCGVRQINDREKNRNTATTDSPKWIFAWCLSLFNSVQLQFVNAKYSLGVCVRMFALEKFKCQPHRMHAPKWIIIRYGSHKGHKCSSSRLRTIGFVGRSHQLPFCPFFLPCSFLLPDLWRLSVLRCTYLKNMQNRITFCSEIVSLITHRSRRLIDWLMDQIAICFFFHLNVINSCVIMLNCKTRKCEIIGHYLVLCWSLGMCEWDSGNAGYQVVIECAILFVNYIHWQGAAWNAETFENAQCNCPTTIAQTKRTAHRLDLSKIK